MRAGSYIMNKDELIQILLNEFPGEESLINEIVNSGKCYSKSSCLDYIRDILLAKKRQMALEQMVADFDQSIKMTNLELHQAVKDIVKQNDNDLENNLFTGLKR